MICTLLGEYPQPISHLSPLTTRFSWKVWRSSFRLASAEAILSYLNEAVDEQGLREKIRLNTNIETAEFSSRDNMWHLTTSTGERYSSSFLIGCMGYYSYENPYIPHLPGQENFAGRIVHPQFWTEECDEQIKGAKVAMIGSGATAVTILPCISDVVEKLTLIQRTPSYIAALPRVRTMCWESHLTCLFLSERRRGGLPEELAAGGAGGEDQQVEAGDTGLLVLQVVRLLPGGGLQVREGNDAETDRNLHDNVSINRLSR